MERAQRHLHNSQRDTSVGVHEKKLIAEPGTDIDNPPKKREISKNQLINKLNYINFLDKYISINFLHKKYNTDISIKAKPQPYSNGIVECLWVDENDPEKRTESYTFNKILIPDGRRFIIAEPDIVEINRTKISFSLPETSCAASSRKTRRHGCRNINVYLTQNGALYYGSLISFTAFSFKVEVMTTPPQTFGWMDTTSPLNIIMSDGGETLYTGECGILRETLGQKIRHYILEPLNRSIRRFKPKEYRSTRQNILPLPTIVFTHPLFKKDVHLQAIDMSGSGMAVEEEFESAVLLPGMIIPELEIRFGDGGNIRCKAQVIYSKKNGENERGPLLRCGIVILDMAAEDHVKLLSVLYQAKDKNTYVSNRVDLEKLWNFFFETGFIYPEKYAFIQQNKNRIKRVYQKLYTETPKIARHFIYQKNSRILGHMAMIRFYERSWMIHHHAAIRSSYNKGGMAVLNQIGRFINDSHRLHSIKMDFVFCYYRPANKFPNHVFGGATRNLKDPKGCSLDGFAYFHFLDNRTIETDLLSPWSLSKTEKNELHDLEAFYEHESGGLMIHALGLELDTIGNTELTDEYKKIGLTREKYIFSLRKADSLKAIIVVNISDIGLNMSDLTNAVKVIILNPKGITKNIMFKALSTLFKMFNQKNAPVLMFPSRYADELRIPYEKIYNLWVLNMQHTDDYFRYLKRLLKFIQH